MKIVLTGSTGLIGSQILQECLSNPAITSVVALSRRELKIQNSKLEVIIHEDFSTYPPALISQLADADACIYCLGSNVPVSPPELNRKINFDYAVATANMFAKLFDNGSDSKSTRTKTLRFVYLSGALPEKDPEKRLWFLAENRRMRGELENSLLQLGKEKKNTGFEVYIARPGFVQEKGATAKIWLIGMVANVIVKDYLAACMVDVAVNGHTDTLLENDTLTRLGRQINLGKKG
jgi:nucleoside-diphosphate-sugar epimerase